jgi:uncharacterized protein YyaL (SSP411 family)
MREIQFLLKRVFGLYFLIFVPTCKNSKMPEITANRLTGENSLYLQQHAGNPVNWFPWSDEAWEKAKRENKLVLISIGYSSCHWCHVMEKETFEDTATARIMNEKYVCIKVDREERPDIDQVYMSAVQLMTGHGGWPLNCFTLPDGKPVYGGTYFPNATWKEILVKLHEFYTENPDKARMYADELTAGISENAIINVRKNNYDFSKENLGLAIEEWKKHLDNIHGGPSHTPKFPLPNNYNFLMQYAFQENDTELLDHVKLTLTKIADGGIYDHAAGGFSRYSVDAFWKVPHFEKMLYDNAQLVILYSNAYKLFQEKKFKDRCIETLSFLKEKMSDHQGGYYSAIDADSEGEEGKYYVWTKEEIRNLKLPPCGNADPYQVFEDYFSMNDHGYWEKENYILLRTVFDQAIIKKFNISEEVLNNFISESKKLLNKKREERIPPALDKKIITSWNALQISALCSAYEAFGTEEYRIEALRCASVLLKNAVNEDGFILHLPYQKNNLKTGYLEDYAFTITALIRLYQISFEEQLLLTAKKFTEDAIKLFYDEQDGFFWYTSNQDRQLIARKKETADNVIPSSNSEMAIALFFLSVYFDEKKYAEISDIMLASLEKNFIKYPSSYSNWEILLLYRSGKFNELVITGEKSDEKRKVLASLYLPYVLFAGSSKTSNFPLLENRFQPGKTLIYICKDKSCQLPTDEVSAAIRILEDT